ncbi:DUF4810 domain-containing protein [Shewanella maritima]|uniref:DUF4810 domain-containing protein n=1 Tax=Shewanella maritima TaxID=2520507 RepID=UPI003734C20B
MRIFAKLGVFSAILLISGCATVTESGYYWGGYSETYYDYIKTPSDKTLDRHIEELYEIVEFSKKNGLKVPPGIYAELGYILAKQGKQQESFNYYQQETQLYPESKPFIERLIADNNEKGNS